MSNYIDELREEKRRGSDKIDTETDMMASLLDMIYRRTGQKTAIILKISMEISKKDRKIVNYFVDNNIKDEEKLEKASNFYDQINKLFSDFEKELSI